MVFKCSLLSGEFHPDIHRRGNDYLVVVPIGYDLDENTLYSLIVSLGPQAGGDMELIFYIYVEDFNGIEIESIFESYRTKFLFTKTDRRLILEKLLFSIELLIQTGKPASIFFTTNGMDAEEKAMQKYVRIALVCKMCGYVGGRFDSYCGEYVWKLTRSEGREVDTFDTNMP